MAVASENQRDANSCVDQIVHALQTKLPRTVSEVVKSGSLGQGTAIPGDFDLDLVAYFPDLDRHNYNKRTVREYLEMMDHVLSREYHKNYERKGFTPHTLQFNFSIRSYTIEVDLLPSPVFGNDADIFYTFLKPLSDQERRMFSCTAAKWIQDFFQAQCSEVKEYIRRAKAWRNKIWLKDRQTTGRPKSFLISLLVIKAFDECSQQRQLSPYQVTEKVKSYVLNYADLRIHWTHNGAIYGQKYVGYFKPPYIIDPSNPFNNVYDSGIGPYDPKSRSGTYEPGDGNWSVFVRNVGSLDLTKVNY